MPEHGHQPDSFHRPGDEVERLRGEAIAELFADLKRRMKALFSHDSSGGERRDEHAGGETKH
jgi:hypothetical protein